MPALKRTADEIELTLALPGAGFGGGRGGDRGGVC